MKRCALVLAGGDLRPTPRLAAIAAGADLVIAADGGLRHAKALGVEPSVLVGDFDSVTQQDLDAHAEAERQRHPTEKGKLDLELAIDEARRRGAERIVVMGGLGDRLDQTLAALLICARLQRDGLDCRLHGDRVDAFPLAEGGTHALETEEGTTFSVVSLDDRVVVSVRGAKYTVERTRLPFGVGLGVSNVAGAATSVSCHEGLLVVILERSHHE